MRRTIVSLLTCTAVALPMQGAAADPTAADAAARASTRLTYTFQNGESLRAGTRVVDSAGARDNGRVVAANGGRLFPVRHGSGRAAQFPDKCVESGCPRAIIVTPHRKPLNPQRRPFRFGAEVRVAPDRTAFTSTIVQKGDFDSPNGRWRLRVNRSTAKPYCLVKGTKGFVRVRAPQGIADSRWHALSCSRQGRTVRLRVDGSVVAQGSGPIGRVANRAPIKIGGTGTFTKNNQFYGRLDRVQLRVGR